MMNDVYLL